MAVRIDNLERYQTERSVMPGNEQGLAFGETFGLDVPTRYSAEIHSAVNALMAADSILTPAIFGMSGRTVWFCRALAAMLWVFREGSSDLPLRRRLEIETISGIVLLVLAAKGTVTRNIFERAYLLIGGVMMIGNALMTQGSEA